MTLFFGEEKVSRRQRVVIHGRRKAYIDGCRCAKCQDANTQYHQHYRAAHLDYFRDYYRLRRAHRSSALA